ncbi:Uncharacterised protein [BD1-7 clade bacterium]|uniref:DUF3037 domain-containing protein n=1 Tax=BD1-7 clade bacterium TaxID=2029982 RepID=A0A5S9PAC2_9GAMM|nr:Uncharacterised protein [BD1-7 clade bacterium]CAA0101416.1 Uncharacterised protein [BD1-7 clade bacterium]
MTRYACMYSVVRFIPYPEAGEFANVGIVLCCPATGYFDFKFQLTKSKRYTNFFTDLNKNTYLRSIKGLEAELKRIRDLSTRNKGVDVEDIFKSVCFPREAILTFSDTAACFVESPKKTLNQKYQHFVMHDFVAKPQFELEMERRVNTLVSGIKLRNPFRKDAIERDGEKITFPFIQRVNGRVNKVIKPFYLGHEEAGRIYDHASTWEGRLRRLQRGDLLPNQKNILFTVKGPNLDSNDKNRIKAFHETCEMLSEYVDFIGFDCDDIDERVQSFAADERPN